jgi:hypothetical protein
MDRVLQGAWPPSRPPNRPLRILAGRMTSACPCGRQTEYHAGCTTARVSGPRRKGRLTRQLTRSRPPSGRDTRTHSKWVVGLGRLMPNWPVRVRGRPGSLRTMSAKRLRPALLAGRPLSMARLDFIRAQTANSRSNLARSRNTGRGRPDSFAPWSAWPRAADNSFFGVVKSATSSQRIVGAGGHATAPCSGPPAGGRYAVLIVARPASRRTARIVEAAWRLSREAITVASTLRRVGRGAEVVRPWLKEDSRPLPPAGHLTIRVGHAAAGQALPTRPAAAGSAWQLSLADNRWSTSKPCVLNPAFVGRGGHRTVDLAFSSLADPPGRSRDPVARLAVRSRAGLPSLTDAAHALGGNAREWDVDPGSKEPPAWRLCCHVRPWLPFYPQPTSESRPTFPIGGVCRFHRNLTADSSGACQRSQSWR